ncbi:flavin reductase [Bradyrhizobium japonicum]|uniref:flavin reductase n=1 Tax=Bradyrhizobium japonicum TaxID=375 RepID=UPI001BAE04C7|nr:flavin reductase [Bradyrhizobium japonicum]MBR0733186.1 flavin reductase [Bradyrhizobium japonicum]
MLGQTDTAAVDVAAARLTDSPCADRVSADEFREALSKLATPVSIVATNGAHGVAGFTCSAVCSITDDPPTLMVCSNRKSFANSIIRANGVLCVSSLSAEQIALSQLFSGVGKVPMSDRFNEADWGILATGAPYCKGSRVALDCRVAHVREVGSHSVIFAEVLAIVHATPGDPLIYHSRSYATIRNVI